MTQRRYIKIWEDYPAETVISPEIENDLDREIKSALDNKIIVYNDNHNTFDHVIKCLQKYCNHNVLQAEQCAIIIHYNGKCEVKRGAYEELKPICEALLDAGLTAKIE